MTFATEKVRVGRQPLVVVELDLDYCGNTYGSAPCTAAVGVTGTQKCWNTRAPCQDPDNFNRGVRTYRFCSQRSNLPVGVSMFPAIVDEPNFSPTKITPGEGLGWRAEVSVTLQDFPHHDRGIDPYVTERNYDPETRGTFFGKLLARNPYYQGRIMRVKTGYITSPWSWDNFETRTYTIESISGPDSNGRVTIKGQDILKLADNERAQAPEPNTGKVLAAIDDVTGTLTLTPTGIGNLEYAASGTYRTGNEIGTFTRSGDTVTLTARGLYGTVADSHDAGDLFQECLVYSTVNVVNILYGLLTDYVGISASYIDFAGEWTAEKNTYLSMHNFSNVISKPEGVKGLIEELCRDALIDMWWDEKQAKVRLKALAPPLANATVAELAEAYDLLPDSVQVKPLPEKRVSRVWVSWDRIDYTERADKAENYKQHLVNAAAVATEGEDQYDSKSVKIILSRWIINEAQASTLAGRLVSRYRDTPKLVKFALDAKDSSVWTGDTKDINTRLIQDFDGANLPHRVQILQVDEVAPGHRYEYEALSLAFSGRYGFIAPNGTGDYSIESETNRNRYAFICLNTGLFSNGDEGYKII